MQDQTSKAALEQAREKYQTADYNSAKAYLLDYSSKLEQVAERDISVELNKLLIEFETGLS